MVLLRTSPWVCAATVLSAVDQVRRGQGILKNLYRF
jgi:hypothetical protein